MQDSTETRIRDLERRVNLLTALVVVEAILLGGLFQYVTVGFLLMLPILAFTHKRLPKLAHRLGRMLPTIWGVFRSAT